MKEKEVFKKCAALHEKEISTGFISSLGTTFLSSLYASISKCPFSTVLYSESPGSSGGFVAGAVSTQKMYKWIIPRYGLLFFFQLCLIALNPIKLKKILETFFYALLKKEDKRKSSDNSVEAELLSIVVDPACRKKGTGKKLITSLEEYFISQSIDTYKVVTWTEDTVSNKFYISCGFNLASQFSHHNNSMNEYHKNISR